MQVEEKKNNFQSTTKTQPDQEDLLSHINQAIGKVSLTEIDPAIELAEDFIELGTSGFTGSLKRRGVCNKTGEKEGR